MNNEIFQVCDKVRLTHEADGLVWLPDMKANIGKTGTIVEIMKSGNLRIVIDHGQNGAYAYIYPRAAVTKLDSQ